VLLKLPGNAAAQVEAVTGMGQVHSDWPLVRVGRPGPVGAGSQRMVGAWGEEHRRARVVLRTGVGDIRLCQGPVHSEPAAPSAPPPAADERRAVLESLARGEITVEEADALLRALPEEA
jgi:hypothetical protein